MSDAELIGRETELAELELRLAEARAGRCVVAHVSGVDGVGKSSLLQAFRQRHLDDALVLNGYGLAWERSRRYGVFRQLLDELPEPIAELADLSSLDPGQVGEILSTWLAERRFETNRGAAARTAKTCLITVDDVHFVDDESLQALVSAARRLTNSAVLIVFCLDIGRLNAAGAGAEALRSLNGHRVVLRGLDVDHMRRLARSVGAELNHQSTATLTRVCAGNPRTALQVLSEQDAQLWDPVTRPWAAPREFGKQC